MDLIRVDPQSPDPAMIARAARVLRAGRLVAFPTETVYGLGANALDAEAVERIYAAKGRPSYNPLIVHVAQADNASQVVAEWPESAARLAQRFWPGPLTMVLPKKPNIPDAVTAGLPSVAVRVPAHPVAHALLAAAQLPVAAPSANRSMLLSPTTAAHVAKSLGDSVDVILDGGATNVGIESTVVDLTTPTPTLLRPGMISADQLAAVIGSLAIASPVSGHSARSSPGMLDRHSSPHARLLLVDTRDVRDAVAREHESGRTVGALVLNADVAPGTAGITMRIPEDAGVYASRLYESLHAMDDAGCDVIVVERAPLGVEWAGVRDRLQRAAHKGI
jgi:L-threonylcarbamoyladenylate synthase